MLDIARIGDKTLATEPFGWACIEGLIAPRDAALLAASFPCDRFRSIAGYDGEKGYDYVARSLIGMGADIPSDVEDLHGCWKRLAEDLLSPAYRAAMTRLTGRDLGTAPIEANI